MNALNNQARAIFLEAIEERSPGGRAAILERLCADDPALRARVDQLLHSHELLGSFRERPRSDAAFDSTATADLWPGVERPGDTIGPYKLRELLGEGGMGSVFVAEQEQPIRRKVALKVIKPGMDSRQVFSRFEAERQALALMDHPNIAKVLDAGVTDSGRPYFVMELVRGVPITEFCDQRRLDPRRRLELLVQVCRAIQHAHQKGVIHRDIKPSNILVTLHDDVAVPKVIDFGIAKAAGQSLTDQTIYTAFNQLIGTPLYMSPEQAEMNALDVDTRSDVYSLGVLLYELLTGSTPFDGDSLRQAGFDEMRRLIREVDPPRPSQRVSTLDAEALSTVSQSRGVDERRLGRALRGDLDWIVMKCLEKDRNRRYESASALAADVQRHLDGEPIEARPPRLFAGAHKWVRRNRTVTTASAVAAILLLMVGAALAADRYRQTREATRFVQHSFDAARESLASGNLNASLQRLAEAQARIDASDISDVVLLEDVAAFQNEAARYEKFIQLCEVGRQHQDEMNPWIPAVNEALALYDVMDNANWLAVLQKSALPQAHVAPVSDGAYEMLLQKADDLIRWDSTSSDESRRQRVEKDCHDALVCLDKAASFHAPSRGYYWLLANCAQIQNEKDRETDLRKTALATPPHSAAELFYINRDRVWGFVSHNRGYPDYPIERSLEDHREMLRFDPHYFNGLHYMGLRLSGEHRYQEALIAFYGCLAMRPGDYQSLCFRAETHLRLKQVDEAMVDANKIIELWPDLIDGWTDRGRCYLRLKEFDHAANDFTKAIHVHKTNGHHGLESPMGGLASLLATAPDDHMRNGTRALQLATGACELNAYERPDLLNILAEAYAEQGNFEKAVEWAKKALEKTNDEELREDIQKRLEKFEAGQPWRIDASTLDPERPTAN